MLICPVCKLKLSKIGKSYKCINNHTFDISKQGYTTLFLKSSKHCGDNKKMVEARTNFLKLGYYDQLIYELDKLVKKSSDAKIICDCGCGEGYYTNKLAKLNTDKKWYAFDMSKEALKYASKHTENVDYFLSSIFDLPFADNSCDIVLNIFAPCASEEFRRVLNKDGIIIKVDPGEMHLYELKELLYEKPYKNEFKSVKGLTVLSQKEITYTAKLATNEILDLFMMTPYSYKTDKKGIDKIKKVDKLEITISFLVTIYQ